jgi:hypothetical protein
MFSMGISETRTPVMGIAPIDIEVMTTATVMTVGARMQYPRTQEHRRGSGVLPDPDNWLATGTVSAVQFS